MNEQQFYDALGSVDLEPGVYYHMTDEDYNAIKAIRNSTLNIVATKTLAHLHYYLEQKIEHDDTGETSEAKEMGSLCHIQLLKPDLVEESIKIIPAISKNSSDFKYALIEMFPDAGITPKTNWGDSMNLIKSAYPDVALVTKEQAETSRRMVSALKSREKTVNVLLKDPKGATEVVFVWIDQVTGLKCKAKIDYMAPSYNAEFDYKTTGKELHKSNNFKYSVGDYGYARQRVYYRNGAMANGIDMFASVMIVQETKAPFLHKVFELEGKEWQIAEGEVRVALDKIAGALRSGVWSGYTPPPGRSTFLVKLPYDSYNNPDLFFEEGSSDLPFDYVSSETIDGQHAEAEKKESTIDRTIKSQEPNEEE